MEKEIINSLLNYQGKVKIICNTISRIISNKLTYKSSNAQVKSYNTIDKSIILSQLKNSHPFLT